VTGIEQSHVTLRKVLVTNIQIDPDGSAGGAEDEDDTDDSDSSTIEPGDAPTSQFLVTVALDAPSSERLVFAAEHGAVWLSLEPSDAPDGATKVVTGENVYR
jgi:pilus assembly protein CpaB